MSASILLLIGVASFLFGFFVYSIFFAKKILNLDDKNATPEHNLRDDVDYVPTNKFVLWAITLPPLLEQP